MESLERLRKVAREAEGFVVTGNVKFPVRRRTAKAAYAEYEQHGYEIDLEGRGPTRRPVLAGGLSEDPGVPTLGLPLDVGEQTAQQLSRRQADGERLVA